ncbi:enoyl-CoA hydratase/isomerase family protein [Phaeovulum sp.]|uniref:enoyl-CoA hydratase/isomerase family protein n=1 Tax=Phaeovulum sp. TaxID=2934796 RepID=UPI0039E71517
MSDPNCLLTTVEDGVAQLVLNRPDAMNTMTPDFLEEVLSTLEAVANDDAIRVLIVTGAGRAFCAGGDLKRGPGGAVAGDGPLASQTRRLRTYMRTSQLLRDMPKITISAINGACAGAGFSWACATDLRYAAKHARFATAFRNAALSGDFGGTWLLPRIVGAGRARELYLRSQPIDAAQALEIGLISGIEEAENLLPVVIGIARDLAAAAPLALPLIKRNLNDADEIGFAEALDREAARHSAMVATKDGTEAALAFTEKRKPNWSAT